MTQALLNDSRRAEYAPRIAMVFSVIFKSIGEIVDRAISNRSPSGEYTLVAETFRVAIFGIVTFNEERFTFTRVAKFSS